MKQEPNATDARVVLDAFFEACDPRPSGAQVRDWQARHPEHAADIAEFAEAMNLSPLDAWVDPSLDAAASSAALADALEGLSFMRDSAPALPDLVASSGWSLPKLTDAIGLARSVMADVVAGRVLVPVGNRLALAISEMLGVTRDLVDRSIQASFAAEAPGMASSDGQPEDGEATWEEAVMASGMTEERKAYWLAAD